MGIKKKRKFQQHICILCGRLCKSVGVVHHLRKIHHIEPVEYFLTIMEQPRGYCLECGMETKFVNIFRGYLDFCGDSCKGIKQREQIYLTTLGMMLSL